VKVWTVAPRRRRLDLGKHGILWVAVLLTYIPFWILLVTSLKSVEQFYHSLVLPQFPLQWGNYVTAWGVVSRYILNSTIVTLSVVLGVLVVSSMSAFAFARYSFPGRTVLFYSIISLLMVPGILTLVPAFVWIRDLGLLNTRWALILPGIAGEQVFAIFVLRAFMAGLPEELFEAARVDGAGMLRSYWHIALPLSKPILSVVVITATLATWNDYIWPLIVISDQALLTIPIGLAYFQGLYQTEFGPMMAGYVIGSIPLLVLFFWAYEVFDLWASPWLTAWVIMAYFVTAFVIDAFFKGAAFCKYVCPIGQFNFINGLVAPLEVTVRDASVCASCPTKDCIKGREIAPSAAAAPRPATALGIASIGIDQIGVGRSASFQTGCELWLFQPQKVGNTDCTFCLDCVQACPYDNVGILGRQRTAELARDARRAGVGRFSNRTDLAALVCVLVFAAFINAFGMVGPFYAVEQWLQTTFGGWVMPVFFALGLVALPFMFVSLAAWVSRTLSGVRVGWIAVATHFSYGLVPLGFAMWLAHYLYHFLTGALTFVPVLQSFFAAWGLPILGAPRWTLGPVVPPSWLLPIEIVVLDGGLLGALVVLYRIAKREHSDAATARRAFAPWAMLVVLLFAVGVWLLLQPMDMRGTLAG
jgi:ABC-type glycerol-3-phosphate transport system permease component/ferredoxin